MGPKLSFLNITLYPAAFSRGLECGQACPALGLSRLKDRAGVRAALRFERYSSVRRDRFLQVSVLRDERGNDDGLRFRIVFPNPHHTPAIHDCVLGKSIMLRTRAPA